MDKEIKRELRIIGDNLLEVFKQIKILNFDGKQFNYQSDSELADVVDYVVRCTKEVEKLVYTKH